MLMWLLATFVILYCPWGTHSSLESLGTITINAFAEDLLTFSRSIALSFIN